MKRLLVSPLLVLLLIVGCAPVRHAVVDGLNEIGGSHNVLAYAPDGISITPGEAPLRRVNLDVQGTALATVDPACTGTPEHLRCVFELLPDSYTVILTGKSVTATVTYQLPGSSTWRHEILTD